MWCAESFSVHSVMNDANSRCLQFYFFLFHFFNSYRLVAHFTLAFVKENLQSYKHLQAGSRGGSRRAMLRIYA